MTMKKIMGNYDVADVLDLLGLAPRRSMLGAILPAVGLMAAGAVIGAGIGLAFAPSSGQRFRQDVTGRLEQLRDRVKSETTHRNGEIRAVSAQG